MIKYLFSELNLGVKALLARVVYLKLQTSESNYTAQRSQMKCLEMSRVKQIISISVSFLF